MGVPDSTACEQDMVKLVQDMAEIFFSEEFNSLRQELEAVYHKANVENAFLTAFKDALFAILAQEDKAFNYPGMLGE